MGSSTPGTRPIPIGSKKLEREPDRFPLEPPVPGGPSGSQFFCTPLLWGVIRPIVHAEIGS